jgi:nucleotide-binding universal stress UspA family protein
VVHPGAVDTIVVATDASWRWGEAFASSASARIVPAEPDAPALIDTADREDAALVVVASAPPAVAEHLARHARRPYAVIPAVAPAALPRRVAIGLDGSHGAAEAVRWCAEHWPHGGAAVIAIEVVNPPAFLARELGALHEIARRELHGGWTARLSATGASVTESIIDDDRPATALLAAASRARADALVIGARALVGLRLIHHDGVTVHALRNGTLPVVVVPARQPVTGARDGGSEEGFRVERVL